MDSSSPPVHSESKGGCVNMQYYWNQRLALFGECKHCTSCWYKFLCTITFLPSHCNYSGSMHISTHMCIMFYLIVLHVYVFCSILLILILALSYLVNKSCMPHLLHKEKIYGGNYLVKSRVIKHIRLNDHAYLTYHQLETRVRNTLQTVYKTHNTM